MPLAAEDLVAIAERLVQVRGVDAVLLGGSRARGDHTADSDTDVGVYYRQPLDTAALGELARELAGPAAQVSEPGGWGPWVDGGSWLTIDGAAVDWIYRDLDRVQAAWTAAREGRIGWHQQPGHPLGFLDVAYAGEVALSLVLADPTGELTALKQATSVYPPALADALVEGLWEADFLLDVAGKVTGRPDRAYVAGCLFRALGVCVHALHGRAGRWLVNEKGMVDAAGRLPGAPVKFAARAHGLFTEPDLARAGQLARELVAEVRMGGLAG